MSLFSLICSHRIEKPVNQYQQRPPSLSLFFSLKAKKREEKKAFTLILNFSHLLSIVTLLFSATLLPFGPTKWTKESVLLPSRLRFNLKH